MDKSPKNITKIKNLKAREKADDAFDRSRGIKEGSKKDIALDKKNGVPEDVNGKAKRK